jgi:hypothetical protein
MVNILLILIYSILFGITMKVADLLDEHGLKWFKGSTILFGILWGFFGILLILSNNILANVILAMIIGFILRFRIDYLNHGIAASMILITFLLRAKFEIEIFLPIFIGLSIFGLVKDYILEKKKEMQKYPKIIPWYAVVGFLYSLITNIWVIFLSLIFFEISYIITDFYGQKAVKK